MLSFKITANGFFSFARGLEIVAPKLNLEQTFHRSTSAAILTLPC